MKNTFKHGLCDHKIYYLWKNIKSRCYYKSRHNYNNYGGRGIIVCDEWRNDFLTFFDWCINNGWREGLQIDRINNDGDYEPNNCRFVTNRLNTLNARKSPNTSGFTGVHYYKRTGRWQSSISVNGGVHLGYYPSLKEALFARNRYIVNNDLWGLYPVQMLYDIKIPETLQSVDMTDFKRYHILS